MTIKEFNQEHNPFYYWWKVRKFFKRPKCHITVGKNIYVFGMTRNNPIFGIEASSLGWKWKFHEVRHEYDPFIRICLFKKWSIVFTFNWESTKDKDSDVRSMATWEAILDFLYNNKTLRECVSSHVWQRSLDAHGDYITIHKNLTKKCLKILNL